MIISNDTVLLFVSHNQSFLLKLESVSEANIPSLREAKIVDRVQIVTQLEGKVLIFIGIAIEIMIDDCRLRLDHILEAAHVFYGG